MRFIPEVCGFESVDDVSVSILVGLGAPRVVDLRRAPDVSGAGAVVLFTGLSGSGKSTIAQALVDRISQVSDLSPVLLDGDHVRQALASELGFSEEDRNTNLLRQAWVGARVAEGGGIAVCAPIAPFAKTREKMRQRVEPESSFLLVHVSTPLAVCEERDRKGLYARARAGEIPDFTGVDSPYEIPEGPDVDVDASKLTVSECVDRTMAALVARGVVERPA